MRIGVIVGSCLMLASAAFAGDGDGAFCEPCINVDSSISPTPVYQTVAGTTVGQPNAEYSYSFCAVGGAVYRFTCCEGGGSAAWDTALSVQPFPCGIPQICNDDFCGLQSQIDWVAPANGTYVVNVDGFGSATGTYVLAYRGAACQGTPVEPATWGSIKSIYN